MTIVDYLSSRFTLIALTKEDIPPIVELSDIIGWDYTLSDLNTIFESGVVFGHKTKTGQLISTAAIFPYDNKFSSIGMVIVHPHYRGLRLGKIATQACLDRFKGIPTMLVATKEGIPLYERMGFTKVDTLYKLIASKYTSSNITKEYDFNSRAFIESDFDEVTKLDEGAFGVNRKEFLKARIKQSKDRIVLTDSNNKTVGFGLSIELPEMLLIGPIIAPDTFHAEYLIHTLINKHKGQIRIDVPSDKIILVNQLQQCGFDIVNQPPVMVINTTELPNRNDGLYGIAAQAFG
jgi:N-acetylglutamate synthase-like GNAT family acetyltransferase